MVTHGEGKEDAPILSAEDGTESPAIVWSCKMTSAEVRQRTNTKDIVAVAESLKWKLGGHVARMDQCRWAHATSVWDVRIGKRRTGRQKTRWADMLKRVAGGLWSRTA
jgi:hypothetical protein